MNDDQIEAEAETHLCAGLFDALRENSLDPPGVSRASYGPGERMAHALVTRIAAEHGLETRTDFAGNLFVTLPGRERDLPAVMTGSHLDAVPHGGNFDGAAGFLAGLGALVRLRRFGLTPRRDVITMAIRAEEMSWFPTHYIGSRAAFGLLPAQDLDAVRRFDTGRTLADHMTEEGFMPERIRAGERSLDPARIHCFVELHIEQGPVLVDRAIPVGIVTGIRGNVRYRHPIVRGAYGHAGAVPRQARRDAVLGAVAFAGALEAMWLDFELANRDFVATIGQFTTDAAVNTITKIAGEVRFTIDMRSEDEGVLSEAAARLDTLADCIGGERGLTIDLGTATRAPAALMDPRLQDRLRVLAIREGVPAIALPSGAGHDCATFANQGVPSAMIFVRNDRGSHNPDESMEIDDFSKGMRLLMALVDDVAFA